MSAFILALVTLYQIVLDLESPRVAKLAIVAMAVFPVAFYLFAPYAEALAALFTFLTYLLMKRRQWMLAVGAGIGAGLAQPSVIPLAVLLRMRGLADNPYKRCAPCTSGYFDYYHLLSSDWAYS